jgi:hypothetical protein
MKLIWEQNSEAKNISSDIFEFGSEKWDITYLRKN